MTKIHQIINILYLLPLRCRSGDGERWHAVKKAVVNRVEIDPDTHVR